jgi:ABC-type antimicrobial peptide transport system permease subunit
MLIKKIENKIATQQEPRTRVKFHRRTKNEILLLASILWQMFTFSIVLFFYLDIKIIKHVVGIIPFLKPAVERFESFGMELCIKVSETISFRKKDGINQLDLIELAIRNMKVKRTRTIVTVGGMMVGISAVVFLVSIGYGIQNLVISRVAKLEEIKQTDVVLQTGRKIKINDKTIEDFRSLSKVKASLPMISAVGKVNYNNSVSDMAVYAVPAEYLEKSAMKPVQGEFFKSNELTSSAGQVPAPKSILQNPETLSEKTIYKKGEEVRDVDFSIAASEWLKVRESADKNSKVIGYTKKVEELQNGKEIAGDAYDDNENGNKIKNAEGNELGLWIGAEVPLWEKKACDEMLAGCEEGSYLTITDSEKKQVSKIGYFAEIGLAGITTEVDPDNVNGNVETGNEPLQVPMPKNAYHQAVVSQAMLKILGIDESEAVGKAFNTSFIIMGDLLDNSSERIESASETYRIVGVIPETKTPLFYVPFIDLRMLGINNYSQAKVVVDDPQNLSIVRKQIEAMGYNTHSVVDTVNQINSFFATARIFLALVGMIALAVAGLGMFNTLTVSLLERTREIGLMKAMGMRSEEVRELFLTESMTMGFFGGLFGLLGGFASGKILSAVLSIFSISKGLGPIGVASIPVSFVLIIVVLSIATGVITGIYPARRATSISALNALRYE